jgi:hypothetical protein
MTANKRYFYNFTIWSCIFVCLADFIVTYSLGKQWDNYNPMFDPISKLGSSISPVSLYISAWWVLIGIVFILFGISFKKLFNDVGKAVHLTYWIIIIYGIGEGLGSGLFPYNFIGDKITPSGILHEIFGGTAVFIILVLPLVLRKIFNRKTNPMLHRFLLFTFIAGILMITLLSISRFPGYEHNIFAGTFGLWQFFLTVVIYCNLIAMAVMMIKKIKESSYGKN